MLDFRAPTATAFIVTPIPSHRFYIRLGYLADVVCFYDHRVTTWIFHTGTCKSGANFFAYLSKCMDCIHPNTAVLVFHIHNELNHSTSLVFERKAVKRPEFW